jgi:hypothetical protein
MILCKKYKVIFYHIPKNAGSSIRKALLDNFEGEKIQVHIPVSQSRGYLNIDDYIKFAVVRNPYSRMVSWYHNLRHVYDVGEHRKAKTIARPERFDRFVKFQKNIYKGRETKRFQLWDTQKSFIFDRGKVQTDYIIKYENLQNDFDKFCKKYFGKTVQLDHIKKWGVQDDWQKHYNDELANIVYNRLREDFEEFGYKKDFN